MERVDRSDGWSERSSNLDSRLDDEKIIVAQSANTCRRSELNLNISSEIKIRTNHKLRKGKHEGMTEK
jgi:hypothetical protein